MEISKAKRIRSIVAASSGNLVEWYDFYIYAFSAIYFAHTFSTSQNDTIQQINAFLFQRLTQFIGLHVVVGKNTLFDL